MGKKKYTFEDAIREGQELIKKDRYFDALMRGKTIAGIRYQLALRDEHIERAQHHKMVYDTIDKVADIYLKASYFGGEKFEGEDYEALEDFIATMKKEGYWYERETEIEAR